MKKILLILIILNLFACAKVNSKNPLNPQGSHYPKWLEDNHATNSNEKRKSSSSLLSCTECHGDDFKGGTSNLSCSNCHTETGVHPIPWAKDGHNFMALKEKISCAKCHGDDYRGGNTGISCYLCHNGPEGKHHSDVWINEHATETKIDNTPCTECHGSDYKGGTSNTSCYKCHMSGERGEPHPPEWGQDIYRNHRDERRSTKNCALSYCHGQNLKGGTLTTSWGQAPSCSSGSFKGYECHD